MLVYDSFDKYCDRYTAGPDPREALSCVPYLDIEEGPWVAGGFVRRVIANLPWNLGDIDYYIPRNSPEETRHAINDVFFEDWTEGEGGENGTNYWGYMPNGMAIVCQTMHDPYPSLANVFQSYDFTCSAVATDGQTIASIRPAIQDIERRRLRIIQSSDPFPTFLSNRVQKLCRKEGYKVSGMHREELKWMLDYNPRHNKEERHEVEGPSYGRVTYFYRQNPLSNGGS